MNINITLSGIANVLALVNAANSLTLDETKVTLGVPAARTPDANPRNTTLNILSIADQGFTGNVDVTYTRLGMGSGVADASFDFTTDGTTTTGSFATQVATQLGLRAADILVTGTLPAAEGDTTTMTVAATVGSLLYVGTQALTVTWPVPQVPLAEAVTVTEQDGFDAAA